MNTSPTSNDITNLYTALYQAVEARSSAPIFFYTPNPGGQMEFHQSPSWQRFLLGGNASGKSYAALGAEVAYHVVPEIDEERNSTGWAIHPYANVPIPNTGWISSKTDEIQAEPVGGTQSYVKQFIWNDIDHNSIQSEKGVWRSLRTKSGCNIMFKTVLSGMRAYTSGSLNWIAQDEPCPRSVWNEITARLFRTTYGRMWASMTLIADPKRQTTIDEVLWVAKICRDVLLNKKQGIPITERNIDVILMHVNENASHINMTRIEDALAGMEEWERLVRLTGEYMELNIPGGFDQPTLSILESNCRDPLSVGCLVQSEDEVKWNEVTDYIPEKPIIKIWHFPVEGHHYAIGVDIQGTNDPTSATVGDMDRKEVVAEMTGLFESEAEVAYWLQLLGIYYNGAEIAIEVNKEGKTACEYMRRGYKEFGIIKYAEVGRLYRRAKTSDLSRGWDRPSWDYGWRTDNVTRDLMIGEVRSFLVQARKEAERGASFRLPSAAHINEMRTFLPNKYGKLEAAGGYHDDRVISLGILLMVMSRYHRKSQLTQERETEMIRSDSSVMQLDKDGRMSMNLEGVMRQVIENQGQNKRNPWLRR